MRLRFVSLVLLQCFLVRDLAFAEGLVPLLKQELEPRPTVSIQFPPSVAAIEDAYLAEGHKFFYLLQDAHTNVSGQYNLSKTLSIILDKEKDLKYVFTEAGAGDNSLSFLRNPDAGKEIESIARSYIKKGYLHGAEFLDLTSERNFTLWGVEDLVLYSQALEDYRQVAKERSRFELYLKKIASTTETLKNRLLNPALATFDKERNQYREEKLPLTGYFTVLMRESMLQNIPVSKYGHLELLQSLREKEADIDFEKANAEHQKAIQALSDEARQELEDLAGTQSRADKVLQGRKDVQAYFLALQEKLGNFKGEFPELFKYFDYLELAGKVEAREILKEIDSLERDILGRLILNEDERLLIKTGEVLFHLNKLFRFTLTPEEYETYREGTRDFSIEALTGFLNKKIMDLGAYYDRSLFLEKGYDGTLERAESFYQLTRSRDEHFLKEALEKMEKEDSSKAVLITGGFHTANLKSLLKAKGISYVSITPQVWQETNLKKYESVLLGQDLSFSPGASRANASTIGVLMAASSAWGPELVKDIQQVQTLPQAGARLAKINRLLTALTTTNNLERTRWDVAYAVAEAFRLDLGLKLNTAQLTKLLAGLNDKKNSDEILGLLARALNHALRNSPELKSDITQLKDLLTALNVRISSSARTLIAESITLVLSKDPKLKLKSRQIMNLLVVLNDHDNSDNSRKAIKDAISQALINDPGLLTNLLAALNDEQYSDRTHQWIARAFTQAFMKSLELRLNDAQLAEFFIAFGARGNSDMTRREIAYALTQAFKNSPNLTLDRSQRKTLDSYSSPRSTTMKSLPLTRAAIQDVIDQLPSKVSGARLAGKAGMAALAGLAFWRKHADEKTINPFDKTAVIFPMAGKNLDDAGADLYEKYDYVREVYSTINSRTAALIGDPSFDVRTSSHSLAPHLAGLAYETALWEVYKREVLKGNKPKAVVGVSRGVVAAFHASGVIDLPLAVEFLVHQLTILRQASRDAGGRLLGVVSFRQDFPQKEFQDILTQYRGVVAVKITNERFIIAAPESELPAIQEKVEAIKGKYAPPVYKVSSHDPYLAKYGAVKMPSLWAFESYLKNDVLPRMKKPEMPLYSNLSSGKRLSDPSDLIEELRLFIGEPIDLTRTLPRLAKTLGIRQFVTLGGTDVPDAQIRAGLLPKDATSTAPKNDQTLLASAPVSPEPPGSRLSVAQDDQNLIKAINRRGFLQGLAATATVPTLPRVFVPIDRERQMRYLEKELERLRAEKDPALPLFEKFIEYARLGLGQEDVPLPGSDEIAVPLFNVQAVFDASGNATPGIVVNTRAFDALMDRAHEPNIRLLINSDIVRTAAILSDERRDPHYYTEGIQISRRFSQINLFDERDTEQRMLAKRLAAAAVEQQAVGFSAQLEYLDRHGIGTVEMIGQAGQEYFLWTHNMWRQLAFFRKTHDGSLPEEQAYRQRIFFHWVAPQQDGLLVALILMMNASIPLDADPTEGAEEFFRFLAEKQYVGREPVFFRVQGSRLAGKRAASAVGLMGAAFLAAYFIKHPPNAVLRLIQIMENKFLQKNPKDLWGLFTMPIPTPVRSTAHYILDVADDADQAGLTEMADRLRAVSGLLLIGDNDSPVHGLILKIGEDLVQGGSGLYEGLAQAVTGLDIVTPKDGARLAGVNGEAGNPAVQYLLSRTWDVLYPYTARDTGKNSEFGGYAVRKKGGALDLKVTGNTMTATLSDRLSPDRIVRSFTFNINDEFTEQTLANFLAGINSSGMKLDKTDIEAVRSKAEEYIETAAQTLAERGTGEESAGYIEKYGNFIASPFLTEASRIGIRRIIDEARQGLIDEATMEYRLREATFDELEEALKEFGTTAESNKRPAVPYVVTPDNNIVQLGLSFALQTEDFRGLESNRRMRSIYLPTREFAKVIKRTPVTADYLLAAIVRLRDYEEARQGAAETGARLASIPLPLGLDEKLLRIESYLDEFEGYIGLPDKQNQAPAINGQVIEELILRIGAYRNIPPDSWYSLAQLILAVDESAQVLQRVDRADLSEKLYQTLLAVLLRKDDENDTGIGPENIRQDLSMIISEKDLLIIAIEKDRLEAQKKLRQFDVPPKPTVISIAYDIQDIADELPQKRFSEIVLLLNEFSDRLLAGRIDRYELVMKLKIAAGIISKTHPRLSEALYRAVEKIDFISIPTSGARLAKERGESVPKSRSVDESAAISGGLAETPLTLDRYIGSSEERLNLFYTFNTIESIELKLKRDDSVSEKRQALEVKSRRLKVNLLMILKDLNRSNLTNVKGNLRIFSTELRQLPGHDKMADSLQNEIDKLPDFLPQIGAGPSGAESTAETVVGKKRVLIGEIMPIDELSRIANELESNPDKYPPRQTEFGMYINDIDPVLNGIDAPVEYRDSIKKIVELDLATGRFRVKPKYLSLLDPSGTRLAGNAQIPKVEVSQPDDVVPFLSKVARTRLGEVSVADQHIAIKLDPHQVSRYGLRLVRDKKDGGKPLLEISLRVEGHPDKVLALLDVHKIGYFETRNGAREAKPAAVDVSIQDVLQAIAQKGQAVDMALDGLPEELGKAAVTLNVDTSIFRSDSSALDAFILLFLNETKKPGFKNVFVHFTGENADSAVQSLQRLSENNRSLAGISRLFVAEPVEYSSQVNVLPASSEQEGMADQLYAFMDDHAGAVHYPFNYYATLGRLDLSEGKELDPRFVAATEELVGFIISDRSELREIIQGGKIGLRPRYSLKLILPLDLQTLFRVLKNQVQMYSRSA